MVKKTKKEWIKWFNSLDDNVEIEFNIAYSKHSENGIALKAPEGMHDEDQTCEWSEEDESISNDIKLAIASYWDEDTENNILDWLKSIKDRVQPQNRWKPSDEQIKAISLARSFVVDDFGEHPPLSEILMELEKQLQKIKENK